MEILKELSSTETTVVEAVKELIERFKPSMTKEKIAKAQDWCDKYLNASDTNNVIAHLNGLYEEQESKLLETIDAVTEAFVECYNLNGRLYVNQQGDYQKLKFLEENKELLRKMVNTYLNVDSWSIKDADIEGVRKKIIHAIINKEKEILQPLRIKYYKKA